MKAKPKKTATNEEPKSFESLMTEGLKKLHASQDKIAKMAEARRWYKKK